MNFKLCHCERKADDPTYKRHGDAIACGLCDGFILCDFCRREYRRIGSFPIAVLVIGDHFVCPQHAWVGIAGIRGQST
jgi:hypothetical protein